LWGHVVGWIAEAAGQRTQAQARAAAAEGAILSCTLGQVHGSQAVALCLLCWQSMNGSFATQWTNLEKQIG